MEETSMRTVFAMASCAALVACASADDIRQRPAVWSATYPAPYDLMANCVAVEMTGFAKAATPLINARAKRAEVLVYGSPYGNMLGQFDFRETGDGATSVEYRDFLRRTSLPADNPADKILRQCAKA
jgi:hypothetical protein